MSSYLCPYLEKYICMKKNTTMAFGLELTDNDGNPVDCDESYFTCRETYATAIKFQLELGDGITKVEDGLYRIVIDPSLTTNLTAGKYLYDFEVWINSDRFAIMNGLLEIKNNTTEVSE